VVFEPTLASAGSEARDFLPDDRARASQSSQVSEEVEMRWYVRRLDYGREDGPDWGPSTEYMELDDEVGPTARSRSTTPVAV